MRPSFCYALYWRDRATTERSLTMNVHPDDSAQSRWEVFWSDQTLCDPETAHAEINDPDWEQDIPDRCGYCRATQLAQEAAEEA